MIPVLPIGKQVLMEKQERQTFSFLQPILEIAEKNEEKREEKPAKMRETPENSLRIERRVMQKYR